LDSVRIREVSRHFAHRRLRLTDIAPLLGNASLGAFSRWYGERFKEFPSKGRQRAPAAPEIAGALKAELAGKAMLGARSTQHSLDVTAAGLDRRLGLGSDANQAATLVRRNSTSHRA